jgi:hypothetical protein
MAGNLDDVVHSAEHPQVAVGIALRRVAGEIAARDAAPILAEESLVVAENRAHHRGPWALDDEIAGFARRRALALQIDDFGEHARERTRGRAGLRGRRAGNRGN